MKRLLLSAFALLAVFPASAERLDRIVAVVNDAVVVSSELEAALADAERRLAKQDAESPPRAELEKRVLDQLILSELQLQQAERLGIRVDDQQVNDALLRIARQNNLTLSQFRDVLERDGVSFSAFREKVRREIAITRLRQREVTNRVTVGDQEVEEFLKQQNALGNDGTEYHLAHILVAVPADATSDQVQAARREMNEVIGRLREGSDFVAVARRYSDGRHALEGGDLGWRPLAQVPSLFVDAVRALSPGQVTDPIRSPSGYHLVKLLDTRGGQRRMVTQTHARHILIKTDEVHSAGEIRARLAQLRQRIVGGDDFAALARGHSQDPGSATRGGDLGWSNPGDLVPEFENVMNALAPGQVSEPFESPFGWHVVQVLERRNHDSTADYRRAKAREMIGKRKSEEALELWLRRLRAESFVEYRLEDRY